MSIATNEADLELLASFVNTRDVEEGRDELVAPDALGRWLVERGLLDGDHPVTEADLARAVALREAVRALAARNNPTARASDAREAAETLDRLARDARMVLRFDHEGRARLDSADAGVDGALGRLLGAVFVAMADDRWRRFKACARRSCRWVYYDRSRNRSRTWCSMAVCGNREKARAFRERKRGER